MASVELTVELTVEPGEASQVLLGDVAWHDCVAMDDAIHPTAIEKTTR